MAVVIKARHLPASGRSGMARPVLYCHPDKMLEECAIPMMGILFPYLMRHCALS